MAANSGVLGKATIGATTILNISEWSLDIKHNVQDITSFTDTWEKKTSGLKGATGSLKGQFNPGDSTGQALLQAACLNGTTIALKLYSDTDYYTIGSAYIEGLKVSNKVDGVCEAEFSFVVDGAVS